MGKYDFIKTENIVSVHKLLKLEYEKNFTGEKQELLVKVYPYTVAEKLELTNLNNRAQELINDKNADPAEVDSISNELNHKSAYFILKKDDANIDMETVSKIPKEWINKLIYKALEFEGLTEDQLNSLSKKEIDKLAA